MSNNKYKVLIFYFFSNLILLDFGNQLRKISYNDFFATFQNPIFSIIHTKNTGAAFGMFQNNAYILALFSLAVLLFIFYYMYKKVNFEQKLELFSLSLFSAGALGNLVERLTQGVVIDYIKLNFIEFPVFNAFDIMICSGAFLYFIYVLFILKDEDVN